MIAECKGIQVGKFWIPPFKLDKGEVTGILLYGGSHFYDLERELINIFSGVIENQNFINYESLTYVENFRESRLRRIFYPTTVKEFIKFNGRENEVSNKIYEIDFIKPKTKVNTLAGNPRRQLTLYTALSYTNKLIFDLVGQDPLGAQETFEIVKKHINNDGAAILLDNFDDMEANCTKYFRVEIK